MAAADPGRGTEAGGTRGAAAAWLLHPPHSASHGRSAYPSADRAIPFHLGWDLEEERWALKADQKLCRSKAQKYLMETNRRRRAFEEKRKQREEKEQRFRERVLQQRKIKLQETTEKFQRAHLPASQHKQIVQTKAAFHLEEDLEQIKGSLLTSELCLPSGNKTTFRTTDDTSYSSTSRNGWSHQEQIAAMVGWDKAMQESSSTSVDSNQLLFQKNLKEMQQLLEKQHLSNLENFHQEVKRTDDSESLSSLDSLEAGEQNGNYTPPSESSLTTQCDCALYIPGKSRSRGNDLLYTAENTSKNMHLNNCQRNLDSQNSHSDIPTDDLSAKHNVLTLAEHTNNTEEESSVSHRFGKIVAEFSTSGNQESSVNKAFTFLQNIKEERNNLSAGTASTLATAHPVFNPSKAWASPDSIPGEKVQDLMQDQSFKMIPQKRSKSAQTSSEPIATSGILFPNQRCSSGIPSTADTLPKDKNISTDFFKNTLGRVIETKEEHFKCIDDIDQRSSLFQGMLNASALCNVKQQNNKEGEKANVVETMSLLSDTELSFGTPLHNPLKNNIYDRKRAELFKSILKKESKYELSHFKAVAMNHGIVFGTQPVSSIRDSLELAKCKKSAENKKNNRKLRWCDQINQIITENNEKCYEKSTSDISLALRQCVQTGSIDPWANLDVGAHPSNTMFIKNRQENSPMSKPNATSAKSNQECISLNMFMSTGSLLAKKVPPVSSNYYKIHEGDRHKSKAKISRRPQPVREQLRFVPRNSRGTAVWLPSAPGAPTALGRVWAPQPPSIPAPGSKGGTMRANLASQPLPSSHPQATSGNCLNVRHVLLADCIVNKSRSGSSESVPWSSEVATAMPTPCCSTLCEPLAKHAGSVSRGQTSACQDWSVPCAERCNNTESRLHLDQILPAEETRTTRKGARTALTPKDSATRFVPVSKQRQIFNNCENKHRALTEQRKQTVTSKGWKPTHQTQLCPVQSAFDPAQKVNDAYKTDEVSESTAQFLMAEKLASTPAAEDEILATMESVQPARQPLLLDTAPCLGMSALSIEEEKIFQSLDHLNQRLQNVQEAITRNPSASGVLQIITPTSIQQGMSSPLVSTTETSQQDQKASASNRLQLRRKY